jgi:hypothetical protein
MGNRVSIFPGENPNPQSTCLKHPNINRVGVVVHGGELDDAVDIAYGTSEGSDCGSIIELELSDKAVVET